MNRYAVEPCPAGFVERRPAVDRWNKCRRSVPGARSSDDGAERPSGAGWSSCPAAGSATTWPPCAGWSAA